MNHRIKCGSEAPRAPFRPGRPQGEKNEKYEMIIGAPGDLLPHLESSLVGLRIRLRGVREV